LAQLKPITHCSIGGGVLTVLYTLTALLEYLNLLPMAVGDLAETGLAGPLATALTTTV